MRLAEHPSCAWIRLRPVPGTSPFLSRTGRPRRTMSSLALRPGGGDIAIGGRIRRYPGDTGFVVHPGHESW
jgi:hypothetical protein